jgi:N-acetylneuraminic acid mutarotase
VLVVGGYGAGADWVWHAAAEIWDPATGRWTELTGLPKALAGSDFAVVALAAGGDALVISGVTANGDLSSDVVRFDGATTTWDKAPSLPMPLAGAAAVRLPDGRILVAGGVSTDPPTPLSEGAVEYRASTASQIFDPATNRWSSAGNMPTGRYRAAIALLDDAGVLVAAGGSSRCEGCVPGPWYNRTEPAARFIPASP